MSAPLRRRDRGELPDAVPAIQLFCLPYAGGSAAMFHRWAPTAPPGVHIVPIELPGHGLRWREPPVRALPELTRRTADQVAARVSGPYALYGHSLGALLAYETARVLRRSAGEPCGLLVSGRDGPCRLSRHPVRHLPDDQLVIAARAWGGLPPQLARFPALRTRLLRVLRADLGLAETYLPVADEQLHCPLTAFGGQSDPLVDRAGLATWRRETTGPTEVVLVPGDHLFVHAPAFETVLRVYLRRMVRRLTKGWRRYSTAGTAAPSHPVGSPAWHPSASYSSAAPESSAAPAPSARYRSAST